MKKITLIILILIINTFHASISFADKKKNIDHITKNLRCLICQGQTIHESNSDFAESMKKYIKSELENGKTDEEIFSSLVKKYGQWIVYDPGISRNTLLLWALPLLLFLIGGAIIAKKVLRKYD